MPPKAINVFTGRQRESDDARKTASGELSNPERYPRFDLNLSVTNWRLRARHMSNSRADLSSPYSDSEIFPCTRSFSSAKSLSLRAVNRLLAPCGSTRGSVH